MMIFDVMHQYRITAVGQLIAQWRVPCEGKLSRVDGQLIMIAKDYTNQPTITSIDVAFANSIFFLNPNATIEFAATFNALPIVPAISLNATDLGVEIHDTVSFPGQVMTVVINVSNAPSPFMLYLRPRLIITPLTETPKPTGGRQEIAHLDQLDDKKLKLGTKDVPDLHAVGSKIGISSAPVNLRVLVERFRPNTTPRGGN